ncbi:MAG: hydroxymyristoyl-ACP dehydratase, partial [Betaproteobacteria bacterium]
MLISREAIATMIPHAGSMCLLDGVISWDASRIRC